MAGSHLGRTLIIANPTARSGAGAAAAAFADRFFASYQAATAGYELKLTQDGGDAEHLARGASASGFDTVIALGGDGVIHETVNGLMAVPARERPRLAVVPVGSGNDYGRTLGMALNDAEGALAQAVRGEVREVEVGRVNGTHFVETLSFGLDAAIAIDTTRRRAADTSQVGEGLYVTSALKILPQARRGWPVSASLDDAEPQRLAALIFAVQVGPTYGGGFHICPDADPADGMLDVCFNVGRPFLPRMMALFARARSGRHVGSKIIETARVRRIALDFEREPPVQADGEDLTGPTRFDIEVVPRALRVIQPIETMRVSA
ncbi:MAG: diacylglycerol kinase family lipid kinase [Coriobacteriaceae bacterium]|nr:diacylglycerol kinase family lipid kinase [Coriobacteriaceae bacterium]